METQSNPFRIDGVVTPPHFTDRAAEIARIREALRSPPAKPLIYGPRRMGKTSTILVADDLLVREDAAPGYDFESPFFRGWVVTRALPDMGMERPATWRSTLGR